MAKVWVVTGGIGSGKSTILGALGALGAVTVDADRIGHEVLEPGGAAHEAVAHRWPSVVDDGRIDRRRLGAIVFADPDELRALEAVSHPAIAAGIATRVADAGSHDVVAIEVSVPTDIVRVGWLRTIVADLDTTERRRRTVERGMEPDEVDRRLAAQPDREAWRRRGRWIVSTAGTRETVVERTGRLWHDVIRPG